jgi:hypothetical protein
MTKRTFVLAQVWLALAVPGLLLGFGLLLGVALAFRDPRVDATALTDKAILALAGLALWGLPLAVAGIALWRRRPWGWYLLLVHTGLGAVLWTIAISSIGVVPQRPIHLAEALLTALLFALLAISGFTVYALAKDPPWRWVAEAPSPDLPAGHI